MDLMLRAELNDNLTMVRLLLQSGVIANNIDFYHAVKNKNLDTVIEFCKCSTDQFLLGFDLFPNFPSEHHQLIVNSTEEKYLIDLINPPLYEMLFASMPKEVQNLPFKE